MGISLIQPWEWAVLARCGVSTSDLAALSAANVAAFKARYGAMVWPGLAPADEADIIGLMPAFPTVDLLEAALVAAVDYNLDGDETFSWGDQPELQKTGRRVIAAVGGYLVKAMLSDAPMGFVCDNRFATPKGMFEPIRWRA